MGSTELLGTGRERKIKNENICLKRDSKPRPALLDSYSSALNHSVTLVKYQVESYSLTAFIYTLNKSSK